MDAPPRVHPMGVHVYFLPSFVHAFVFVSETTHSLEGFEPRILLGRENNLI